MGNIMGLDTGSARSVQIAVFNSSLPQSKGKLSENGKSANTDKLEVSEETQRKMKLEELKRQMESAKEQGDAAGDSVKVMSRCMKIAQRIMNGDNVPIKDMKYLRENYPDLMRQAFLFRRSNPEPKDYKSVLEDEEEQGTDNSVSDESADTAEFTESAPAESGDTGGETVAE